MSVGARFQLVHVLLGKLKTCPHHALDDPLLFQDAPELLPNILGLWSARTTATPGLGGRSQTSDGFLANRISAYCVSRRLFLRRRWFRLAPLSVQGLIAEPVGIGILRAGHMADGNQLKAVHELLRLVE